MLLDWKNIRQTGLTLSLAGLVLSPLTAQSPSPASPARSATTITSDSFRLALSKREGIFMGNVVLKDSRFEMTADRMVVTFDDKNTVSSLTATGEVTIRQGGRMTTSRQAEYIVSEKKLVLTGDPVVMQDQNRIAGTVITIFPEEDRMEVSGGRSTVQIFLE